MAYDGIIMQRLATFGIHPLQQISVPFLTNYSIAWDTRTDRSRGGQRWFHLYPGEANKAGDELYDRTQPELELHVCGLSLYGCR